ncbi:mCG146928 [Mus musculus]|nr:mCG146928 [Mus musculus]
MPENQHLGSRGRWMGQQGLLASLVYRSVRERIVASHTNTQQIYSLIISK